MPSSSLYLKLAQKKLYLDIEGLTGQWKQVMIWPWNLLYFGKQTGYHIRNLPVVPWYLFNLWRLLKVQEAKINQRLTMHACNAWLISFVCPCTEWNFKKPLSLYGSVFSQDKFVKFEYWKLIWHERAVSMPDYRQQNWRI